MDVVVPRIMEIGQLRKPMEACGVVVPDLSEAPRDWVKELTNRSPSPHNAYDIDPATITDLLAAPEIWGNVLIWHTHPSGHVGPSRGDMHARIDGLKYLVVTLPNGEAVLF